MMRRTLVLVLFSLTWTVMSGQLNFTAGYRAGFVFGNDDFNELLKLYSSQSDVQTTVSGNGDTTIVSTYFEPGFENLSYLNGIDLGLLYRSDDLMFQIEWKNKRKENTATYNRETELISFDVIDTVFKRSTVSSTQNKERIITSINAVSLGFQYAIGPVSLGTTIDYNWLRMRGKFQNAADPPDFKDQSLSSHFSLSFNFGSSGNIGFTLQPYVQLYWDDFEISANDVSTRFKLNTFGFALIVRNGPQRPW